MDLLVLIAIIALIVWLVAQFVPLPARLGLVAQAVWMICITLIVSGLRFRID